MTQIARPALALIALTLTLATPPTARGAGGPTDIGNFGPTGLELRIEDGPTLRVLRVQDGSPAAGTIAKGELITAINGVPPLRPDATDLEPFAEASPTPRRPTAS